MGDVGELGKEVEEEEEEEEELLREEKERNFSRVEEFNINTWKFREVNPAITRSLEDELDLSNWEPVAETLGLTNSQIERCQRSDAFTHAVFTTMEECPHFQDLTVKRFLKTLLEHNRRDILSKPEKFVRLKPGSDAAKTFTVYPEGSAGAGGGILLGQCACNTQAHFSKRLTLCCRYCRLSFCVRFRTETSAERVSGRNATTALPTR
ncbi:uncharacterized protein LOC135098260 isoform X1 [Scylla paramamosain]|uniref:uncharacterized protein LOC135098260 isoform X1 n=2 Tax=Scylla paramamosain TaxID=85552 RepID=UPI003082DF29